jgi:hypothetical protein
MAVSIRSGRRISGRDGCDNTAGVGGEEIVAGVGGVVTGGKCVRRTVLGGVLAMLLINMSAYIKNV